MVCVLIKYQKKTEKTKKCDYTVLYGFYQLLTNPNLAIAGLQEHGGVRGEARFPPP